MGKISVIVAACVATSLLAAQAANAGSVTASLTSVNPGTSNLSVSFTSGTSFVSPTVIGEFNWNVTSYTPAAGDPVIGSTFTSFCIEGTQSVHIGNSYTYTLTPNVAGAPTPGTPMGATTAAALEEFWTRNIGLVGSNNTNAAAFQLGVWEIVNDGAADAAAIGTTYALNADGSFKGTFAGLGNLADNGQSIFLNGIFRIGSGTTDTNGVDTGTPTSSDAAVKEAITMLEAVHGSDLDPTHAFGALESGTSQDQLGRFAPPLLSTAVPLPAALPVGGAMLGAMGVFAGIRNKRRKA